MTVMNLVESAQRMVTVNKSSSVRDTLQVMHDYGFISVPVVDQNIKTFPQHISGFVDLLDLLAHLLLLCKESSNMVETTTLGKSFFDSMVGNLMDLSSRDHFKSVLEEEHLATVVNMFAQGVHRVAVVDIFQEIRHIVAQSDVVRVVASNLNAVGPVANKTVQELGFLQPHNYPKLVVVNADDSVLNSFQTLHDTGVSAAPIIDNLGNYVGTLSASDLRNVQESDFTSLLLQTAKFAEAHSSGGVFCRWCDPIGQVIAQITTAKVHRAWVVDGQNKPVSVITLSDICRILSTPAM